MKPFVQKFTNGLAFGLWAAVMVIAVSLAYAATTYYSDLPTASSGATMRSADWNALVNYANRAVKQDTEVLTVTWGKVGIGRTNPDQAVVVNGGIGFWSNYTVDKKLYSPADWDLEWMTSSIAWTHGFAISNQGTKIVYLNTNGYSYFNGGNIWIWTTSPSAKLDVNGTVQAFDINTTSPWYALNNPAGWGTSNGAPKCRWVNGWIEFRGIFDSMNLSAGWPAGTYALLPPECRPQVTRYTEMPCHTNATPRNAVCNNDFYANGNVGIHTDYPIIQLRFDGVRIWGWAN